jgi:hypothetical protein
LAAVWALTIDFAGVGVQAFGLGGENEVEICILYHNFQFGLGAAVPTATYMDPPVIALPGFLREKMTPSIARAGGRHSKRE